MELIFFVLILLSIVFIMLGQSESGKRGTFNLIGLLCMIAVVLIVVLDRDESEPVLKKVEGEELVYIDSVWCSEVDTCANVFTTHDSIATRETICDICHKPYHKHHKRQISLKEAYWRKREDEEFWRLTVGYP